MHETIFKTVTLPAAAAGGIPTVVGAAGAVPVRVLVRNASATLIFLAQASQDVVGPGGVGSSAYRLAAGQSDVFVLAPGQQLYGAANGVAAIVSVSISDALPLV